MKVIGFLINSLRNNGPTRVLINIVNNLDNEYYKPVVFTLFNQNDPSVVSQLNDNVVVHCFDFKKNLLVFSRKRMIKRVIKDYNVCLLHTHGHVPTFLIRKFRFPKVSTIHNRLLEDFVLSYGKVKGRIINFFYVKSLKRFDGIVACSESGLSVVQKYLPNSIFIRNGMEISNYCEENNQIRAKIRNELEIPYDSHVFIYAGNITKLKGIDRLSALFKEFMLSNEHFVVVGNGPLLDDLKKDAPHNIHYLGFKTNVKDYMLASDVYVSNSRTEGFSVSVLEALDADLFLLLSNIPSHNEVLDIDRNVYIGEIFDEHIFGEKLECLRQHLFCKNNSPKEYVMKYLSAKIMADNYCKLYHKLLKE